ADPTGIAAGPGACRVGFRMTRIQDLHARGSTRALWRTPGAAEGDGLPRLGRSRVFQRADEVQRCFRPPEADAATQLVHYLFIGPNDPPPPHEVFDRLRWGGQVVFVSRDPTEVLDLSLKYRDRRGFVIERDPAPLHPKLFGVPLPFLGAACFFFAARKVLLV